MLLETSFLYKCFVAGIAFKFWSSMSEDVSCVRTVSVKIKRFSSFFVLAKKKANLQRKSL